MYKRVMVVKDIIARVELGLRIICAIKRGYEIVACTASTVSSARSHQP